MNKKQYPYRHVSVTYWLDSSRMYVMIYNENKDGSCPEGHEGREYNNVSNHAMLKLTSIIQRYNVQPHIVMGDTNVSVFFWLKRKRVRS